MRPPPVLTEPFATADTVLATTIPITVDSADGSSCALGLTFDSDSRASANRRLLTGSSGTLGYFIEDAGSNILRSDSSPANKALLRVTIPVSGGSGQGSAAFRLRVEHTARTAPGLYRSGVTVRLFDLSGKTAVQLSQSRFEVTATVRSGMLISLGNVASGSGNATALMDLGGLYSGLQQTATFTIRSNSAYTLKVMSQNGGRLKLRENASGYGTAAEIPYTLSLAGQTVLLGTGYSTVLNATATSAQGQSYPLLVSIPQVADKLSGLYEDMLSLTIEAR
jgi:spore coat protein U-like protein